MATFEITVGIDISKNKFDAARLQDGKYRHKTFPNTNDGFLAFVAWLATFGLDPVLIAMEATGAYSIPLAKFLADKGFWVSVINPAQVKGFAESELSRAKTDKADAKLIARYAREKQPPRWNPPPPVIYELQLMLRRVEQLIEMIQMENNRLDTADPSAESSIKTIIAALEQELEVTREKIRAHIDADPDLSQRRDLLDSIPGIGEATIPHLLVLLSDYHGFLNARQVAAFIGLAPNPNQSGRSGNPHISKIGDALYRKILYMPAISAWQHNPIIKAFCERLKANGKKGKAIICAAMRKLIHIAFAILKSGKPFDPNFATK